MTEQPSPVPDTTLFVLLYTTFEHLQQIAPSPERAEVLGHFRALRNTIVHAPAGPAADHEVEGAIADMLDYLRDLDAGSLGADEARAIRQLAEPPLVAAILARSGTRPGRRRRGRRIRAAAPTAVADRSHDVAAGMADVAKGTPEARALGRALRHAREEAGLTLRAFAVQLNRDPGVLSRWETGERNPHKDEVAQVLTMLGVTGDRFDEIIALTKGTEPALAGARESQHVDRAYEFVKRTVAHGGSILFVGTRQDVREAIAQEARQVGMPFVNQRWLGGMLTNFHAVHKRLQRLEELEALEQTGGFQGLTKKEILMLTREKNKLERILGGVRNMAKMPNALLIVDTKIDHFALYEARKLRIPVVAILDTHDDPEDFAFPIPRYDNQATWSAALLTEVIAEAAAAGLLDRSDRAAPPTPAVQELEITHIGRPRFGVP